MKKYLKNGQKVELIEITKNGFLVQYYYNNGCDFDDDAGEYQEYRTDNIFFHKEIFDSPPTETLHGDVKNLKDEVVKLQAEKNKLLDDVSEAEESKKLRLEKLKKYDQLKYIEDFLDEKITHFVTTNWDGGRAKIETFEEKAKYKDGREFKTRMLCLYGDGKKTEWRLHHYSDGSGHKEAVFPYTSYELALKKVHEILSGQLIEIRKEKESGKPYYASDILGMAEKYNFELPEWVTGKAAKEKEDSRKDKLKEAEKAKATAEQKIKELKEVI